MPSTASVRELRVTSLQAFKPQGAERQGPSSLRKVDRVLLAFDLDADLAGAFNWNVKQLFVYLSATFATPTNVRRRAAPRRAASRAPCCPRATRHLCAATRASLARPPAGAESRGGVGPRGDAH